MADVGYIRKGKGSPGPEGREEEALSPLVDRMFVEEAMAGDGGRPQFYQMMKGLAKGDVLHVSSIACLGRSARDILQVFDALAEKGVALVSPDEGIDTRSEAGTTVQRAFAALYRADREAMAKWQEGYIQAARKRAGRAGRPGPR